MTLTRSRWFVLAAAWSAATAAVHPGQPNWDSGFDGTRAWRHVAALSADSMRGRYSGFPGSDRAETYISRYFTDLGLVPPFGASGYFQEFVYGAGEYVQPFKFVIHHSDGRADTAGLWREVNIFKYSGFGRVQGRLVFVGFGVSAPEEGWDDYAGLDAAGAVVLVFRGTPDLPGVEWGKRGGNGFKSAVARAHGAVGLIVTDADPPKWATLTQEYYQPDFPAVWISKTLADTLLKGTGRTKDEWVKFFGESGTPASRDLGLTVELEVSGTYHPRRPARNLAAILPGADPALAREVVVVGAHYDHHGLDAAGNLYPGADDNASGTAAMMELARVFAAEPTRRRRSILFTAFAAEEEGLVGSKKFVDALPIPGYDVVAMLNMDMVGQGNGLVGIAGLDVYPLLGEVLLASWPDSVQKTLEYWSLHPSSDHYSFARAGINTYAVGARGEHPNYHTPNDTAGNIKPEVLKAVGDMVYHCAAALADYPYPLTPVPGSAQFLLRTHPGVEHGGILGRTEPRLTFPWANPPHPLSVIQVNPKVAGLAAGLEALRRGAQERGMPFLADSVRRDWTSPPYRGCAGAVALEDLPSSADEVKALARLGLGFVTAQGPRAGSTRRSLHRVAERHIAPATRCLEANLRLWLECAPETDEHWDAVEDVVEVWKGHVVCVLPRFGRLDRIRRLARAGGFVLFQEFADTTEVKAWLDDPETAARCGIEPRERNVQVLIKAGADDFTIGRLLIGNLQRALLRWEHRPVLVAG